MSKAKGMLHSDGSQNQGSQGQQQGSGGIMGKAKGMLHDLKDGNRGSGGSGGEYTRPGNEGDY